MIGLHAARDISSNEQVSRTPKQQTAVEMRQQEVSQTIVYLSPLTTCIFLNFSIFTVQEIFWPHD